MEGTVKLVGTNTQFIVEQTERLLTDQAAYKEMAQAHNLMAMVMLVHELSIQSNNFIKIHNGNIQYNLRYWTSYIGFTNCCRIGAGGKNCYWRGYWMRRSLIKLTVVKPILTSRN